MYANVGATQALQVGAATATGAAQPEHWAMLTAGIASSAATTAHAIVSIWILWFDIASSLHTQGTTPKVSSNRHPPTMSSVAERSLRSWLNFPVVGIIRLGQVICLVSVVWARKLTETPQFNKQA
jgi:hypothetical protein